MTAALKIAQAGFDVMLVEKEDDLGGKAREIYHTIDGLDVQAHLKQLIGEVENHPRIQLLKGTTIEKIDGFVGNFKTRVQNRR